MGLNRWKEAGIDRLDVEAGSCKVSTSRPIESAVEVSQAAFVKGMSCVLRAVCYIKEQSCCCCSVMQQAQAQQKPKLIVENQILDLLLRADMINSEYETGNRVLYEELEDLICIELRI